MGHLHFKKELHETGEPCDMKVSRTVRRGGYGVHFTVEHSVPTLHILPSVPGPLPRKALGFTMLFEKLSRIDPRDRRVMLGLLSCFRSTQPTSSVHVSRCRLSTERVKLNGFTGF